jgi:hypothetical protein
MVLLKIALVAASFAALLGFARDQMWFERAGILSNCQLVTAPHGASTGGQWWSCNEGALNGLPNLAADHCQTQGIRGNTELWFCPVAIVRPTF